MIDISVLIGSTPRLIPASEYGLGAAVRELRQHSIAGALVAADSARHECANDQVLAAAGSSEGVRLYPVATLNPVQWLGWRPELERVIAAGAVGIRVLPEARSEAFAGIVSAVGGRCPLLVSVRDFGDASSIGAATARLGTPVILVGGHYTQLGDCLAAMERWPHLYLETSRLAQFRGVETVVRSVGAQRLLFGSGAPARAIQAALNAVLTADISDDDKSAVLRDNASRVFGLPAEPFQLPTPTQAEHLIDVHAHIGSLAYPTPPAAPDQWMARHSIERSYASSLQAIAEDMASGNMHAFEMVNETLRAYVVVNPNDLESSCQTMDAAYKSDYVQGAKLHCTYSGVATASRACLSLIHEVARRGRPLKIHVEGADWDDALADVAIEYPSWKVIVAHAGPGTPSRAAARLVERTSNVYVELSSSFADLPTTRDVVRRVGPERLLFGSDAPLLDPAYVLGIYADACADLARATDTAREVLGQR